MFDANKFGVLIIITGFYGLFIGLYGSIANHEELGDEMLCRDRFTMPSMISERQRV